MYNKTIKTNVINSNKNYGIKKIIKIMTITVSKYRFDILRQKFKLPTIPTIQIQYSKISPLRVSN